jgi:hypothetical protein
MELGRSGCHRTPSIRKRPGHFPLEHLKLIAHQRQNMAQLRELRGDDALRAER